MSSTVPRPAGRFAREGARHRAGRIARWAARWTAGWIAGRTAGVAASLVLGGLAGLVVPGCAAPPPAFDPPEVATGLLHFAGTPLSGPLAPDEGTQAPVAEGEAAVEKPDADPGMELEITLAWLAGGTPPEEERLAERAQLIVGGGGLAPLRAAPRIDPGCRLITGESATALAARVESGGPGVKSIVTRRGLFAPGLTCVVGAAPVASAEAVVLPDDLQALDATDGDRRAAFLPLALGARIGFTPGEAGGLRLGVALVGHPRPAFAQGDQVVGGPSPAAEAGAPMLVPGTDGTEREMLLLDGLDLPIEAPIVVALPWAFDGGVAQVTLLALVTAHAPADADELRQRALAEAGFAHRLARRIAAGVSDSEAFRATMVAALRSLGGTESDRTALIFLADATRARLAGDLTLVLDGPRLEAFVSQLQAEADAMEAATAGEAAIGWRIERVGWRFALDEVTGSDPPSSIRTLLEHHGGEAGRYPALVDELLGEAGGLAAFQSGLRARNREFLSDGQPGPRVRAFDWLRARGLDPPGYDPLADHDARTEALARALAAGWGVEEAPP